MFRTRTWFLTALVVGGFCEVVGYLGRLYNATRGSRARLQPLGIHSSGTVAADCACLVVRKHIHDAGTHHKPRGRLVPQPHSTEAIDDHLRFWRHHEPLHTIDRCRDVDEEERKRSNASTWIIIGGLAVQFMFFGYFLVVAIVFHRRLLLAPTSRSALPAKQAPLEKAYVHLVHHKWPCHCPLDLSSC